MDTAGDGFEIIEHTADVGIRATAGSLEHLFEQATLGLAEIIGTAPGTPTTEPVTVTSDDLGGLLVDWLSEVLYLHEVRDALIAGASLARVARKRASGHVELVPRRGEVAGTQVKAITYHGLRVERSGAGWVAEVFVDV